MAAQQDIMIMPGSEALADAVVQAENARPVNSDDAHHCDSWAGHDASLMERLLYNLRTALAVPHT